MIALAVVVHVANKNRPAATKQSCNSRVLQCNFDEGNSRDAFEGRESKAKSTSKTKNKKTDLIQMSSSSSSFPTSTTTRTRTEERQPTRHQRKGGGGVNSNAVSQRRSAATNDGMRSNSAVNSLFEFNENIENERRVRASKDDIQGSCTVCCVCLIGTYAANDDDK